MVNTGSPVCYMATAQWQCRWLQWFSLTDTIPDEHMTSKYLCTKLLFLFLKKLPTPLHPKIINPVYIVFQTHWPFSQQCAAILSAHYPLPNWNTSMHTQTLSLVHSTRTHIRLPEGAAAGVAGDFLCSGGFSKGGYTHTHIIIIIIIITTLSTMSSQTLTATLVLDVFLSCALALVGSKVGITMGPLCPGLVSASTNQYIVHTCSEMIS